jgi:hypothetical protein
MTAGEWHTTAVATRAVLLEHVDPAPWYDGSFPIPAWACNGTATRAASYRTSSRGRGATSPGSILTDDDVGGGDGDVGS